MENGELLNYYEMNVNISQKGSLNIKYVESFENQDVDGTKVTNKLIENSIKVYREISKVALSTDKIPLTIEVLINRIKMSKSTIKRSFKFLKAIGLLQITQIRSSNGTKFLTKYVISPERNEAFAAESLKDVSISIKMYNGGKDIMIDVNVIKKLYQDKLFNFIGDIAENRFKEIETKIKDAVNSNKDKSFYLQDDKRLKVLKQELNEEKGKLLSLCYNLLYKIDTNLNLYFIDYAETYLNLEKPYKDMNEAVEHIGDIINKQISNSEIYQTQNESLEAINMRIETLKNGVDIIASKIQTRLTQRKNQYDLEIERN